MRETCAQERSSVFSLGMYTKKQLSVKYAKHVAFGSRTISVIFCFTVLLVHKKVNQQRRCSLDDEESGPVSAHSWLAPEFKMKHMKTGSVFQLKSTWLHPCTLTKYYSDLELNSQDICFFTYAELQLFSWQFLMMLTSSPQNRLLGH